MTVKRRIILFLRILGFEKNRLQMFDENVPTQPPKLDVNFSNNVQNQH